MDLINLRLLSHPINWAFVWVVLALSAMAFSVIHDASTQNNNSLSPD